MNKVKLIDVAKVAGVSKSTVSQFLNGRYQYMSPATKSRIEKTISELNYLPNSIARSLKTDKTKTIGVIVRDIAGSYTSRAIRGMDDHCKKNDYNLIIYNTDFDPQIEAKAFNSLSQLRVDGIIMVASGGNAALISSSINRGTPVVQFQLEREKSNGDMIVSDYKQGAFEATEYLIELGHRRICFLTQEFKQIRSRNERYDGYTEALNKAEIPLDQHLTQYWHRTQGFRNSPIDILKMNNPPTAIFSQHLAITTDLLKQLNQAGVSIPEDVSVIGFDDLPMADFFRVPITVVKQEPYQIGKQAAKRLIQRLDNSLTKHQRVLIPCSLVKRDSCQKLVQ